MLTLALAAIGTGVQSTARTAARTPVLRGSGSLSRASAPVQRLLLRTADGVETWPGMVLSGGCNRPDPAPSTAGLGAAARRPWISTLFSDLRCACPGMQADGGGGFLFFGVSFRSSPLRPSGLLSLLALFSPVLSFSLRFFHGSSLDPGRSDRVLKQTPVCALQFFRPSPARPGVFCPLILRACYLLHFQGILHLHRRARQGLLREAWKNQTAIRTS